MSGFVLFFLQLLEELKKVHFKLDNQECFFLKSGDFVSGYDLIMWEKDGDHRSFKKQGRYHVLDEKIELDVDVSEFNWLSSSNNTVRPRGVCQENHILV